MDNNFRSPRGTQGTVLVERDPDKVATIEVPKESGPVNLDEPALVGVSEPVAGQRFVLKQGKTTIGRRPDSDVVLPHASVSSMHAWVIQDKGGYRVMNILSTNGTFVNNERITETAVHHGDRIRFGGVDMVLHTGFDASDHADGRGWLRWASVAAVVGAAVVAWFLMHS